MLLHHSKQYHFNYVGRTTHISCTASHWLGNFHQICMQVVHTYYSITAEV